MCQNLSFVKRYSYLMQDEPEPMAGFSYKMSLKARDRDAGY
jgi:hypothetical protein